MSAWDPHSGEPKPAVDITVPLPAIETAASAVESLTRHPDLPLALADAAGLFLRECAAMQGPGTAHAEPGPQVALRDVFGGAGLPDA